MKKEFIYYSILTLVIALLLFFETNLFNDNTKFVSKVVEVKEFEKLDIDLNCNIYVSIGEEQKVVFEGSAKYLNKVETHLENGVLKIFCKKPGLFAELLNYSTENPESINIYVKLTDSDQLIMPKKGNLISNETLQLHERNKATFLSLNYSIENILRLISNQLGFIRIR